MTAIRVGLSFASDHQKARDTLSGQLILDFSFGGRPGFSL